VLSTGYMLDSNRFSLVDEVVNLAPSLRRSNATGPVTLTILSFQLHFMTDSEVLISIWKCWRSPAKQGQVFEVIKCLRDALCRKRDILTPSANFYLLTCRCAALRLLIYPTTGD
jgi:hypothetical protein